MGKKERKVLEEILREKSREIDGFLEKALGGTPSTSPEESFKKKLENQKPENSPISLAEAIEESPQIMIDFNPKIRALEVSGAIA